MLKTPIVVAANETVEPFPIVLSPLSFQTIWVDRSVSSDAVAIAVSATVDPSRIVSPGLYETNSIPPDDAAAETAAPPSNSPFDKTFPLSAAVGRTVSIIVCIISSGVNVELTPNISAATPAAWGAAIEVPFQLV